jgi:hypothetical protein
VGWIRVKLRAKFSLFFLIVIVFSLSINSLALEVKFKDNDFSLKPQVITEQTMVVLDNLQPELDFTLHNLEAGRYLLIYGGHFYMLNVDSKVIKTENGELELPNKILQVNHKLLVPVYFIDLLPELEVEAANLN